MMDLAAFGDFFSLSSFLAAVSNPVCWGAIILLVFMEGILSVDNAVVLAATVSKLPNKDDQKKALLYGIWGAYLFRFIAIGLGVWIIKIAWIKAIGGVFLLYLVGKHFFSVESEGDVKFSNSFWGTVLIVELMDISFSVDSIMAAFGVSDLVWVLFIGGALGILAMRCAASVFIKLLDAYPGFENTAYVLILLIGIKMIVEVLGQHVNPLYFYGLMGLVVASTFVIPIIKNWINKHIVIGG